MVVKLNTVRLNGASLNQASLNGVGERLRASAGGGGGEVIPPEEPDVPDVPVTYILSASASNGVVSASVNGKAVTLPYTANEGDVAVVEVTANDGYQFEGWSDGSTDNPRSITMTADVTLSATCVVKAVEKEYIQFADPAVEAVLMANGVSSDGVGITMEDAAKVTSIGTWFKGNTEITSFDELQYFTGITILENAAFQGSTIQSITLPDSLTTIADGNANYGTFRDCFSLVKIKARGLTFIGRAAFDSCSSLSDVDIDWSGVIKLGINAFRDCSTLAFDELNLASCTSLGLDSLSGVVIRKLIIDKVAELTATNAQNDSYGSKTSLEEVVLSDTLTSIPNYSFNNYVSLHTLNIPQSVTSVGTAAFRYCAALRVIDFPLSVTSIGDSAYSGCNGLTAIISRNATPPSLGDSAFANTNNCPIYVPDASLEAYKTATNWSQFSDRIKPLSEHVEE